jgi:ankyrin repeat protein
MKTSSERSTPLSKSNFDFIKELLEKGAATNVKNNYGMTPLILGILLLIAVKCYLLNFNYKLCIASARGYIEVVKELLGKGADINVKDNKMRSSLHCGIFLIFVLVT